MIDMVSTKRHAYSLDNKEVYLFYNLCRCRHLQQKIVYPHFLYIQSLYILYLNQIINGNELHIDILSLEGHTSVESQLFKCPLLNSLSLTY